MSSYSSSYFTGSGNRYNSAFPPNNSKITDYYKMSKATTSSPPNNIFAQNPQTSNKSLTQGVLASSSSNQGLSPPPPPSKFAPYAKGQGQSNVQTSVPFSQASIFPPNNLFTRSGQPQGASPSAQLGPNQPETYHWKELEFKKKKVPSDRTYTFDKNSQKSTSHTIKSIAFQDGYWGIMCQNQIRIFSYLEHMGLLSHQLQNGYAAETVKELTKKPDLYFEKRKGSNNWSHGNGYQGNSANSMFGGYGQSGMFGQNPQGNQSSLSAWNKLGQVGSSQPGSLNYQPAQVTNNIFNNQSAQNSSNIFNRQNPNQPNVFNNQQFPNHPQINQQPVAPYDPQVIEGMKGALMEEIHRNLSAQSLQPLMLQFLDSLGVTQDILLFLVSMGLTPEEIYTFIAKRCQLAQIEKYRAQKMNFLSDYYHQQRSEGERGRYQEPNTFPHHSRYPNNNDKFSLYADYILEKSKYGWEETMLHEELKDNLKGSISGDEERQSKARMVINQLEEEDRLKFIQNEFRKREEGSKPIRERMRSQTQTRMRAQNGDWLDRIFEDDRAFKEKSALNDYF